METKTKAEYDRKYRAANKVVLAKKFAKYRADNKVEISAKKKAEYKANPEPAKRRAKKRREENPAEVYKRNRAWVKKNREKVAAYSRKYTQANLEKHALNQQKRRALKKGQLGIVSKEIRQILHWAQSSSCYYCDRVLVKGKIHLEHMIPLDRGGFHENTNLCLSCQDCNLKKGIMTAEEFMEGMGTSG